MMFTKLSLLAAASLAAAHGIVTDIKFDNDWYTSSLVFQDPYKNPVPERIVWSFFGAGNGPVPDFTTKDITCNQNAQPAKLVADVNAGADVTFYWTTWPESHRGPVMTYLANCGGDCSSVDPSSLSYFKIDHAGYEDGVWISDKIIANNNSYSLKLPEDIAPGNYIIRHELLALHSAFESMGAQFYPVCANIKVSGSGTANPPGVTFPGAYKPDDAGILVNIYNGLTSYQIPGPSVYKSGSSSSDPVESGSETEPESTEATTVVAPSTLTTPVVLQTTSTTSTPVKSVEAEYPATTSEEAAAVTTSSSVYTPPVAVTTAKQDAAVTTSIYTPPIAVTTTTFQNLSQKINKCLDDINKEISEAQSKNGGAVDFSSIESKRNDCYQLTL